MHLIASPPNRRRRSDNFGPDLLAADFPGAELVDGRLIETDEGAERPRDQMQFILNDEVRWTQRIHRDRLGRRQVVFAWVRVLVFDLRRPETVSLAHALDLAE